MLTLLRLQDWKSFGADEHLPLGPLTVLVGPNGSGKSNALDALRFLQGLALDYPVSDVLRGRWEGQRQVWPGVRGATVEAARSERTEFVMESTWRDQRDARLRHGVKIETRGEPTIVLEQIDVGDETVLDASPTPLGGPGGASAPSSMRAALKSKGRGRRETADYSAHRSVLGQVTARGRTHPTVVSACARIRELLRRITFLDISPTLMRDYQPENGGHLGLAGENISPVLHALRRSDLATFDAIRAWLSELCATEISDVDFDVTRLREVMLILVEPDGSRVSARSASDGTLRFLGHLVALHTAPAGSLVVLEEPDAGLHPTRIRLLAEVLEQTTSERGIQVVATSHSPVLLAHLSKASRADVVAFAREPGAGTVCRRLGDLEHFAALDEARDIEHLISTGWIERAL